MPAADSNQLLDRDGSGQVRMNAAQTGMNRAMESDNDLVAQEIGHGLMDRVVAAVGSGKEAHGLSVGWAKAHGVSLRRRLLIIFSGYVIHAEGAWLTAVTRGVVCRIARYRKPCIYLVNIENYHNIRCIIRCDILPQ
jgi:hypothetical protein